MYILLKRSVNLWLSFEVERLKERTATKTQNSANFVEHQSTTKSCNNINKKKDPPKSGKSKSGGGPGPSEKKKKAHHGKNPATGARLKDQRSQVWLDRSLRS